MARPVRASKEIPVSHSTVFKVIITASKHVFLYRRQSDTSVRAGVKTKTGGGSETTECPVLRDLDPRKRLFFLLTEASHFREAVPQRQSQADGMFLTPDVYQIASKMRNYTAQHRAMLP
jgi:hypothetical protein